MKQTYIPFLLLTILYSLVGKAQEQPDLRERADTYFYRYEYTRAIPLYRKLVDTRKPRLADLEKLAESYRLANRYAEAENWYARVIQDEESAPENWIRYGEVLKMNAQYAKAKTAYQMYADKTGDSKRVAIDMAGCDSALVWLADPTTHQLYNESGINTARSEFATVNIQGRIYYVGEASDAEATYGWTGKGFLNVYSAEKGSDSRLSKPQLANGPYKGAYHVGPIVANKEGDKLYVTRTYGGKAGEISKRKQKKYRTNNLELFIYTREGGQWVETPFPYNNVQHYSVGQAALSPDEKILYFVSDMPGGLGGTDIWYCVLEKNGNWSKPIHGGPVLNTNRDEMFPTIGADGTLFFSSNGLAGMGGLDIFRSKGSKNQWSKPLNLRYPINSAGDDFAFVTTAISDERHIGYLSSDRLGGQGADDVYAFVYQKPKIILVLQGVTYNKQNGKELPGATVTLMSGGRQLVAKKYSDAEGLFFFELDKESDYSVHAAKTSYYSDSARVSTRGITRSDTLFASLYLEPLFEIGQAFQLENIHYDFDKHNIRKDAAEILDELVRIMRDNPTLKIELSSHTDSRGSDAYNMALSQRRAQAAVDYLVSHGIARNRMVAQGYGESRLLNHCVNGVPCSKEEHQANRRTEVTVLSF